MRSSLFSFFSRSSVLTTTILVMSIGSVYAFATIGLPWGGDEKRENGYLITAGAVAKTIDLTSSYGAGNCKMVSSPSLNIFVPTGTGSDWQAFKDNANRNVGARVEDCIAIVIPPGNYDWAMKNTYRCVIEYSCRGHYELAPYCALFDPDVTNAAGDIIPTGDYPEAYCTRPKPPSVVGGGDALACGTCAPSGVTGPTVQCENISGTFYKVSYYTQKTPELGLRLDDQRNIVGIGQRVAFKGYIGVDARWAHMTESPVVAYTDSSCTTVVAGPISGSCASPAPFCGTTTIMPTGDGKSCDLTVGSPSITNQSWGDRASSCGYTCRPGWTDDATLGPCLMGPAGPSGWYCDPRKPSCISGGTCTETGPAMRSYQLWAKDASNCGYTCNPGWEGSNCTTPVVTTPVVTTSCAARPTGANIESSSFVDGAPSSGGQGWQNTNASIACYFACKPGYTGTSCEISPTVPECGSSNNSRVTSTPSSNLCTVGSPSTVSALTSSNKYEWTCGGTLSCSATLDCTQYGSSSSYPPYRRDWAYHADDATALQLCKDRMGNAAEISTPYSIGHFNSPGDNGMMRWDGTRYLDIYPASSVNDGISGVLNCKCGIGPSLNPGGPGGRKIDFDVSMQAN